MSIFSQDIEQAATQSLVGDDSLYYKEFIKQQRAYDLGYKFRSIYYNESLQILGDGLIDISPRLDPTKYMIIKSLKYGDGVKIKGFDEWDGNIYSIKARRDIYVENCKVFRNTILKSNFVHMMDCQSISDCVVKTGTMSIMEDTKFDNVKISATVLWIFGKSFTEMLSFIGDRDIISVSELSKYLGTEFIKPAKLIYLKSPQIPEIVFYLRDDQYLIKKHSH